MALYAEDYFVHISQLNTIHYIALRLVRSVCVVYRGPSSGTEIRLRCFHCVSAGV